MESVAQDTLAGIAAKDTWSFEDYNQMVRELHHVPDAQRKLRTILADLEDASPQPKGGSAMKIGIARYMLCRLGEALEAFADATDNKDRRYFSALCHKALHQHEKAAEEFERARAKGWDDLQASAQLVEVNALAGKTDVARKGLAKLADKLSGKAEFYYLQGLIANIDGLAQQAVDSYIKAHEIDPNHVEATFHLAYVYDIHGEEEKALELYNECLRHPPVNTSVLMNLAVLYEDLGRYEKAVSCLETILANNPNHLRARLFLKDAEASMTMYYDEEQAKRVARRNAVLDIPVTDFELSVRARNCLKKMNIRSLGDLVRTSEPDLLAYKNFGETSLKEIKDMLTAKGLRLGQVGDEVGEVTAAPAAAAPVAPAPAAPAASDGVLATSIERVEFSIRARRALQSLNIKTMGDLAKKSEADLLSCKNFGQTSLNEIRQRLAEYGLGLRED